MSRFRFRLGLACVACCLGLGALAMGAESARADAHSARLASAAVEPPTTIPDKIASALSAAPDAVAAKATVLDFPSMKVLRQGSNGWSCFPDTPSPGPDPMCVDQAGLAWARAWMARRDPPAGLMGFGYMLQGGSDASNTDPFAERPEPGHDWVTTGPHVMVFNVGSRFPGYPKTAQDTRVPYVMYPNTPYAHLMVPVE